MKVLRSLAILITVGVSLAPAALADDAARIGGYVLPFYDSAGPVVKIGKYSAGLVSRNGSTFVSTILQMKDQWNRLGIRLYRLGYRNEATYWFYSAQYKGRQFALLVDQQKLGSMGDRGFELYHAQNAFSEVAGPDINCYAFGDIGSLLRTIRRVHDENRTVPDLQSIYPGVALKSRSQWPGTNATLDEGLNKLAAQLMTLKNQIKQQRVQNGVAARFAHVTSRQFPGGL